MRKSIKRNTHINKEKSRKLINLYGGSKCNDLKIHPPEEYRRLCEHNSTYCIWCGSYCKNRPKHNDESFYISYPDGIKPLMSKVSKPTVVSRKSPVKEAVVSRKSPVKAAVVSRKSPLKPAVVSRKPTVKPVIISRYAETVPIVGGEQKLFRESDIVPVPGDGTCLFHAVVIGLKTLGLYEGTGHTLRQEVAQYLKDTLDNGKNLDVPYQSGTIFSKSKDDDLSFRTYLEISGYVPAGGNAEKFMRDHISGISRNKWGTEIDLWAIGKMFPRVNFEVYSNQDAEYLRQTSGGNESNIPRYPTIRIYNAAGNDPDGNHYDALPASRPLK